MTQDKNNSRFICKSTPYGICIAIVLAIGAILIGNGFEKIGFAVVGASCLALLLFLMVFIPNAQRLKFTDKALIVRAYRYHRSYFWNQIYDVYLKNQDGADTPNVILKLSKNITNDMDSEATPYIEIPLDAFAFGYEPEDLCQKIKTMIQ